MKLLVQVTLLLFITLNLASCNSESKVSVLQKCKTLGDESIVYARANYVKLFYYFNAEKFNTAYQQVKDFDHVTHRNIINTYDKAVRKIKTNDPVTKSLLLACLELSTFSTNFVDQAYPRAIAHKSQDDPLSDKFFIQINQIVQFDSKIGVYDKMATSFQELVASYQLVKKQFNEVFNTELSQ